MSKCKKQNCNQDCFELQNESYNLCISHTTLDFDTDMGYVGGNNSYIPLTDKPQINHRVLQSGNNTYDYLGVQEIINDITEQDIDNIIYGG